jgi:hypothetical protein
MAAPDRFAFPRIATSASVSGSPHEVASSLESRNVSAVRCGGLQASWVRTIRPSRKRNRFVKPWGHDRLFGRTPGLAFVARNRLPDKPIVRPEKHQHTAGTQLRNGRLVGSGGCAMLPQRFHDLPWSVDFNTPAVLPTNP